MSHDGVCRRLVGARILVAGGAGAIGAGICGRLLAEGATVVAADRNPTSLSAFVDGADAGEALHSVPMDLGDTDSIAVGVTEAVELMGGLDAVVNAVGISHQGTGFDDETLEGWNEVISVNLTGAFALAKHAVPRMGDGSSIVNITSTGAEMGLPLNLAYGASKGGMRNLTKGLARALADRGIRVNAVGPGLMEYPVRNERATTERRVGRTEIVPLGRLGTGADIGSTVAWLVSADAGWVTGQNIYVDGGSTA